MGAIQSAINQSLSVGAFLAQKSSIVKEKKAMEAKKAEQEKAKAERAKKDWRNTRDRSRRYIEKTVKKELARLNAEDALKARREEMNDVISIRGQRIPKDSPLYDKVREYLSKEENS